jgi:hypothetical protein
MKLRRSTVKRSCDDWDDDWLPWFEVGSHWDLGQDEVRKPRSVSKAAFRALRHLPGPVIGFHKPRQS